MNEVMKELIRDITIRLKNTYGYCAVAEGTDKAMINSEDADGNDIIIKIDIISKENENNN